MGCSQHLGTASERLVPCVDWCDCCAKSCTLLVVPDAYCEHGTEPARASSTSELVWFLLVRGL